MKKLVRPLVGLLLLALTPIIGHADEGKSGRCIPGLEQESRLLHSSEQINLCERFGGRPMLVVNTASHCGFTPQFQALEAIHQKYADDGLVVIGVPSNDFYQEAASESKTAEVCFVNYGVTFTMLSPMKVKGPDAHPLFKYLANETQAPRWNFTKYLVSPDGNVTHRFGSNVEPDARPMIDAIESLL
jgi:glutathione peroxidase